MYTARRIWIVETLISLGLMALIGSRLSADEAGFFIVAELVVFMVSFFLTLLLGPGKVLTGSARNVGHRFWSASRPIPSAIASRRSTRCSVSPERSSVYVSRIARNFRVKCPSSRSPSWMTKSYGIGTHSP